MEYSQGYDNDHDVGIFGTQVNICGWTRLVDERVTDEYYNNIYGRNKNTDGKF